MPATNPRPAPPFTLSVQYAATDSPPPPPRARVRALVQSALRQAGTGGDLTIRFVTATESAALNARYRRQPRPTNVLSFDYRDPSPPPAPRVWGDIAICGDIVLREARATHTDPQSRYAHMIVHGVLHLAGYRHDSAATAAHMEQAERAILRRHRMEDPYA